MCTDMRADTCGCRHMYRHVYRHVYILASRYVLQGKLMSIKLTTTAMHHCGGHQATISSRQYGRLYLRLCICMCVCISAPPVM